MTAPLRVLIGCATSCVALDAFLARGHDARVTPLGSAVLAELDAQEALGNSWAVNCADWIAERIAEVDAMESAA